MNTRRLREFFSRRLLIAEKIVEFAEETAQDDNVINYGEIIEATFDAEIVLCCALSTLSALMWPGRRIDRKRFIQLLIEFAPASLCVDYISVPLLLRSSVLNDYPGAGNELRSLFPPGDDGTIILHTDEIDHPESELTKTQNNSLGLNIIPNIDAKEIRKYAYASYIYSELRSGLVHNYQLGADLSDFRLTERKDIPSYFNMIPFPTDEEIKRLAQQSNIQESKAAEMLIGNPGRRKRYLHFPFLYILELSRRVSETVFNFWDGSNSWEQPEPYWWIDG